VVPPWPPPSSDPQLQFGRTTGREPYANRHQLSGAEGFNDASPEYQGAGDGPLRLSDTVTRWLPGPVPTGAQITVREILEHRSSCSNTPIARSCSVRGSPVSGR
jgi:hypothetical protein